MPVTNPAPLGLFGFATTTWLLSMINAGLFPGTSVPMVLAMAIAFGGTAQFAAGLMEVRNGNTFGFVAFCSYGAFWWSFALFVELFAKGVPGDFVGWYLFVWGVFTFAMWIASFALNRAVFLIFLALWITFVLLAFGIWLGAPALTHAGGYTGLLTALFAAYLAAADVINATHGRTILPVGAKAA
ncbi:acetate uptake transporter [Acidiphilium sp. AL]|uniref:Acetate uptake transporter n=1 Tax=Acidiphilium iwatense TaxID=768198 RepID=A0ABS9DW65_9PROT|nr:MULTISPECIES: acetate uptake transporter [Acidiphilium]MCF3946929.1 acetate uptake transporter [Acidiphilium iwatense]MCU4159766.1 acetate uptake transporter [Acidiphilium sp. AL]